MVSVATPLINLAEPSVPNLTIPLGTTGPLDFTVAVQVMACPYEDGFSLETMVVIVEYLFVTCETEALLGLNIALPPKVALIGCVPAFRVDVVILAIPLVVVPVPIRVPLAVKVTGVPSGTVGVELIVAVNLTGWPTNDGLSEDVREVVVDKWKTFTNTLTEP